MVAVRTAESTVEAAVAVVVSTIWTYNVLIGTDTPTVLDDCCLTGLIVVEVFRDGEEVVEV